MFIIEGVRCSGKSFTADVVRKNFPDIQVYKDVGMRLIANKGIDPDDYAIGRDLAYAQSLPVLMDENMANTAVFDRQYFSSYVYGRAWRKRYDKEFWADHIRLVEDTYGPFLEKITIVFLDLPGEETLDKMKKMHRQKDKWDKTLDFKRQYKLYRNLWMNNITRAKVVHLPSFQTEDFIVKFFKGLFKQDK
jgi:thymidylate kinase